MSGPQQSTSRERPAHRVEWACHLLSSGVYALVNVAQGGTGFPRAGVCRGPNPLLLWVPPPAAPAKGERVRGVLATARRGSRDESHGSLLCFPRTASGNWRSWGAGPACSPGPMAPPGRHASRCLRCRSKEDSAGRGVSPPTPGHPDPFSVAGRVTRPGAGVAGGPAGWCSCPAPALPCCPHAQLQERLFRIAVLDPHTSFGWETRV